MPMGTEINGINTGKATGAICTVPVGFTCCSATCVFSDCCVVWDSNKETGGCGCFFGISSCKTTKIGKDRVSVNSITDSKLTIIFRLEKFESFLSKCKSKGIYIANIKSSFDVKLKGNIIEGNFKSGSIRVESFDAFFSDYTNFINNLTENQKQVITSLTQF